MAKRASLEPVNYLYPTWHTYLILLGIVAPNVSIRAWSEGHLDLGGQVPSVPELTLDARIVSATMGTATVALVYCLGLRAFDRATALLAAAFLALSAGFVGLAHFATVDIPLVFWSTVAFTLICRADRESSERLGFAAAFVTGLASATKYPGILVSIPLLAGIVLRPDDRNAGIGDDKPRPPSRIRSILLCGLLIGIGFLVGTPGAAMEPFSFLHDVFALLMFQPSYAGASPRGFLPHLQNLNGMLGPFLFPVCVIGFAWGGVRWIRSCDSVSGLLILVVIVVYAAMGFLRFHPPRYIAMILPFLALLGAAFVVDALRFVRARTLVGHGFASFILVVGVGTSLVYCVNGVLQFRDDDRVLSVGWLLRNASRDASIELPTYYGPILPKEFSSVSETPGVFRNASVSQATASPSFLRLSRMLAKANERLYGRELPDRLVRLQGPGPREESADCSLDALLVRRPEYLVLAKRWYGLFLNERSGREWPLQRELYEEILNGNSPYVLAVDFEVQRGWLQPPIEFVDGGIKIFRWTNARR